MNEKPAPAAPPIEFGRMPCPTCGAVTEAEAGDLCQPSSDETGEVYCAGQFDADGFAIGPTRASLDRLDAWIVATARDLAPWPAPAAPEPEKAHD